MAKLPEYRRRTQVNGGGPLGLLQAPNFGSDMAQGLAAMGAGVTAAGAGIQRRQVNESLSWAQSGASRAQAFLAEQEADLNNAPATEFEDRTAKLSQKWSSYKSELVGAAKTAQAKEFLTHHLEQMDLRSGDRVRALSDGKRQERFAANLESAIGADSASLNQNPGDFVTTMERQRQTIEGANLSQQAQGHFLGVAKATYARAAVNGIISRDPAGALKELQNGQTDIASIRALDPRDRDQAIVVAQKAVTEKSVSTQASGILAAYNTGVRTGDAALAALRTDQPESDQIEVRQRVRQGVSLLQDQRSRENHDELVSIVRRVNQGMGTPADVGRLDQLYQRNAITEAQHLSYLSQYDEERAKALKAQAGALNFAAQMAAGIPVDPGDDKQKKALDGAFTTAAGTAAPGDERFLAVARGLAKQARLLPPSADSWLSSAARSPDPGIATRAAEFFNLLEATAPEAAAKVDPDTRAVMGVMSSMIGAGTNREKAFETARANVFEVRKDVLEQRRQAFGVKEMRRANDKAFASLMDQDFDGWFSRQADYVPTDTGAGDLKADFLSQTQRYFEKTGDIEVARAQARADVKHRYGVSEVNGRKEILYYAPEKQFPGLTAEMVRGDVGRVLTENAAQIMRRDPTTGKPVAASMKAEDVRLVPSAETDRTGGKRWNLGFVDEFGAPDVLRDAKNRPLTYALPVDEESVQRMMAEQRQKQAEALAVAQGERVRRDSAAAAMVQRARSGALPRDL